jgi:threonyl-tRNA synthetase
MAIVGGREEANRTVSIRSRDEGDVGSLALDAFLANLERQLQDKR